jgi:TRAP-type mannitol/chloroaromatic compound transport system permease large subunit
MTAFLIENIAPLMFATLVIVLLIGYPVAFSLAAVGLGWGIVGIELGLLQPTLLQALPERIWGVMSNDTLLAVPFFTFMGLILERSGMAEDLLDTIGQLFGPVRGGLAYAVIFVGALLAATTGVVAASVISMGLISLPIMLRYGYDRRLASGVIAASGTLAQIIPPSLVLIIMADQLGRSVGDMYEGAFIPGIVLAGFYAVYVLATTFAKPEWAPALPPEARTMREPDGTSGNRSLLVLTLITVAIAVAFWMIYYDKYNPETATDERIVITTSVAIGIAFFAALINKLLKLGLLSKIAERVTFVLIPPLALIFLVLGTIFLGVATPTEGGAMGATGALIMALARRRLSFSLLRQAMNTTAKLSTFVVFILIGARVFSLTFYGVLPRLLRALVHRHSARRGGGRKARHRPDLVRRAAGGQHADVVHASAVRVCAVLPAQRRARQGIFRQAHRPQDGAGDDGADLLGRSPVRADPGSHGQPHYHLPRHRLGRVSDEGEGRYTQHPDRDARGGIHARHLHVRGKQRRAGRGDEGAGKGNGRRG